MQFTILQGDALINTTELSGVFGLIATVVLTCNMVLGMMLSTSFNKTFHMEHFIESSAFIRSVASSRGTFLYTHYPISFKYVFNHLSSMDLISFASAGFLSLYPQK